MTAIQAQSAVLPVLRPDVEFHLGPDEPDGSPTFVLHDPLSGTFEKLTWVQAEILRRLRVPLTVERLLELLRSTTTISVSADEVRALCQDAVRKNLTMNTRVADARSCTPQQGRRQSYGLAALFRKLAYLRIPLINPDAFLERTLRFAKVFAHPAAVLTYLCVATVGTALLLQRFDAYLNTFPYFFNLRGAAAFTLAIVTVKTIHEFSHAYVAKSLGVRVPAMGIALIFMFPLAYADVTDSWRMRSRRRRLWIALAGVLAELVIAGLALSVWTLSPPGAVKSVCFVVSSVTLASTLLINLNPALRYDGYYVLCDLAGIDNLQSRSFELMRWVLRRHLLGIGLDTPEDGVSRGRLAFMLAYAAYAWIYRALLYLAIALMLYHRVTKALGVVLFVAAAYALVVKPVVNEMTYILKMRRRLFWNLRSIVTATLCAAVIFWAAWPLPRWQKLPATTVPHAGQVIYAAGDGVLSSLAVGLGSPVRKGQTLFVIENEELSAEAELAKLEMQRLGVELAILRNDEKQRALLPEKMQELARAAAKLESIQKAIEGSCFVAEQDGVVVEWDDSLREGTSIGVQQILGRIVDQRDPRVVCYVRDDLAGGLEVGDSVYFVSDARPRKLLGTVSFVESTRAAYLEHAGLSSVAGGQIAVRPDAEGRLETVESWYRVEARLDAAADSLRVGQTGSVWLRTPSRSRLADLARYAYRVLLRESSF